MALSRGSRWFVAFGMLALAGLAGGLWWADTNLFADDVEAGQPVEYTVERGQSVRGVGDDLAELGVLRNPVRFRLAADDAGLADELQPGRFELETGMDVEAVIEVLAAGPIAPPTVRFTVQEGLTVDQTLARLDAQFEAFSVEQFRAVLAERRAAGDNGPGLLRLPEWIPEPGEVEPDLQAFEGLLWPQTYEVEDTAEPLQVLQRMVDQLGSELARVPEEQRARLDEAGLYDRLITASLIERETRVDEERGTVAGVIANRLEAGMRLQIDATVVYALGGDATDIVSTEDTEIDDPYNTYPIEGLPPTPISGVGTAALRAAFDPEEVPFVYYVLDPACDGSHRFAETLDEHNANVAAFREGNRCQDDELPA
jgi:UPF0755 protein